MSASSIFSMTGFGTSEGAIGDQKYRVEVKALNHRFLDLKVRIPRELSGAELPLRAALQARFARGAIDLKVDRVSDGNGNSVAASVTPNLSLAKHYSEALRAIQKATGASGDIRAADLASFPEVLSRQSTEMTAEEAWKKLEPLVSKALDGLAEMRKHEGSSLAKILTDASVDLETKITQLRAKRKQVAGKYPERIREKVKGIFEMYPLSEANLQAVLESRISQELAMLADRTDIEEELVRFQGHLDHLRKVLKEGGQVGRKLDFVIQELGREINTLGNKAQDFSMSEEVVAVKVKLEQLREQVMNLE